MRPQILSFLDLIGLLPLEEEVRDLEKARTCAFQANYHLIWAIKYRREVLVGLVEVRLVEVLKIIAENHGYRLRGARVHDGNHVHLFVSVPPKVCIPEMVRVFKMCFGSVVVQGVSAI